MKTPIIILSFASYCFLMVGAIAFEYDGSGASMEIPECKNNFKTKAYGPILGLEKERRSEDWQKMLGLTGISIPEGGYVRFFENGRILVACGDEEMHEGLEIAFEAPWTQHSQRNPLFLHPAPERMRWVVYGPVDAPMIVLPEDASQSAKVATPMTWKFTGGAKIVFYPWSNVVFGLGTDEDHKSFQHLLFR